MKFKTARHTHDLLDPEGKEIGWIFVDEAGRHFIVFCDEERAAQLTKLTLVPAAIIDKPEGPKH